MANFIATLQSLYGNISVTSRHHYVTTLYSLFGNVLAIIWQDYTHCMAAFFFRRISALRRILATYWLTMTWFWPTTKILQDKVAISFTRTLPYTDWKMLPYSDWKCWLYLLRDVGHYLAKTSSHCMAAFVFGRWWCHRYGSAEVRCRCPAMAVDFNRYNVAM